MCKIGWAAPILVALAIFACASARAQSKPPAGGTTASALAPHWNHNGSIVSFVTDGTKQKIFYETPRIGLIDAGVKPGTLLFEGRRNGQAWTGTAYQFYRTCKSKGFRVSGTMSDDLRQITLNGKAPQLDASCNVTGSRDDVLIFTANQSAPNKPPKDTPVAGAPAASASAQTPNDASAANKPDVVSAVAPSAPPETSRASDKPVVEPNNAKSGDASAAKNAVPSATAVAPSEPPKEKPVTTNPGQQGGTVPPSELPKEKQATINPGQQGGTVPPSEPVKDKQVIANPGQQTGTAPPNEPAKDKQLTATSQNTSNAAKSPATGSSAAPSSGPVKINQPSAVASADSAPPKSDVSTTEKNKAQQSGTAPQSEPPKDTQIAAIPGAVSSAAKTDDASKPKNSAGAGGAANDLRAASKSEVPSTDVNKTGTLIENRTANWGSEKMMEIVLKNGRVLRIGRDIDPEVLLRLISLLER